VKEELEEEVAGDQREAVTQQGRTRRQILAKAQVPFSYLKVKDTLIVRVISTMIIDPLTHVKVFVVGRKIEAQVIVVGRKIEVQVFVVGRKIEVQAQVREETSKVQIRKDSQGNVNR